MSNSIVTPIWPFFTVLSTVGYGSPVIVRVDRSSMLTPCFLHTCEGRGGGGGGGESEGGEEGGREGMSE